MKPPGYVVVCTAALLTSFGITTAKTQAAPPIQNMAQGRMMGLGSGMPTMGDPGRMGMMGMADQVERRIAFLKAELKITEAQIPQWNPFADALRKNAHRMGEMPAMMMQGGVTGQDDTFCERARSARSLWKR